ncbi:MAG: protein kinase, partial [Chromatiales bacterium]
RLDEIKASKPSGTRARERRKQRIQDLEAGAQELDKLTYWLKRADTDAALTRALRRADQVVLAAPYARLGFPSGELGAGAKLTIRSEPAAEEQAWPLLRWLASPPRRDDPAVRFPRPQFVDAASGVGLTRAGASGNPEIGEALVLPGPQTLMPSLALRLYASELGLQPEQVAAIEGGGLLLGAERRATTPDFLVFPIPPAEASRGEAPVIAASRLLRDDGAGKDLADRSVVIGVTDPAIAPWPEVIGGTPLSGPAWVAHVVDSLVNETTFEAGPWLYAVQRGLILGLAVVLALAPVRLFTSWGGLVITALVAALLLNTGLVALLVRNIWLPVVLPALFLMLAYLMLAVYGRMVAAVREGERQASEARRALGLNLHAQGQLDAAFEALRGVSPTQTILHHLYQLGHDFERRRQFSKALAVYEFIGTHDRGYRDIEARAQRLQPLSTPAAVGGAGGVQPVLSSTLVLDDPNVAKPTIGRYEIESQLGRGAMGVVYLGSDPKIGRKVAIKALNLAQEFGDSDLEDVKARFYREAEASGRLNHPNIVSVYDIGEEHDLAYIAMDYVAGRSLDHYSRPDGLLPVAEVLRIGIQVAEGLDYAHAQGVVHRDIKPGNIIYDAEGGMVKITDFGIASMTDSTRTRSGTLMGTPAYMSPEQISGERADGRSDLFSLGVTVYQLLVGRLPFTGDSMARLVYKITQERQEDVRQLRPELSSQISRVLNKALQKDPAKRYQTGATMAAALTRALQQWEGGAGDMDLEDTRVG